MALKRFQAAQFVIPTNQITCDLLIMIACVLINEPIVLELG